MPFSDDYATTILFILFENNRRLSFLTRLLGPFIAGVTWHGLVLVSVGLEKSDIKEQIKAQIFDLPKYKFTTCSTCLEFRNLITKSFGIEIVER